MMRKLLAIVLTTIFLFTCIPPVYAINNSDILGKWYMTEMISNGVLVPFSQTGIQVTFTFYNDSSVDVYASNGELPV